MSTEETRDFFARAQPALPSAAPKPTLHFRVRVPGRPPRRARILGSGADTGRSGCARMLEALPGPGRFRWHVRPWRSLRECGCEPCGHGRGGEASDGGGLYPVPAVGIEKLADSADTSTATPLAPPARPAAPDDSEVQAEPSQSAVAGRGASRSSPFESSAARQGRQGRQWRVLQVAWPYPLSAEGSRVERSCHASLSMRSCRRHLCQARACVLQRSRSAPLLRVGNLPQTTWFQHMPINDGS